MKTCGSKWNNKSKTLIKELHKELCLDSKNWHQNKTDSQKRAAELLASALAQLINGGEIEDVAELVIHSYKWLKGEVKDLGCPNRN
tara:strand:- start:359 stop:616 length:258 start_codon:yes stop_codon:yes gene_type:complete